MVSAVRGRCPLMLRTAVSVVLRTTRVSPSVSSIARVVSETATVTVWCACPRPRATFWLATMITPVFEARRCTRTGSVEGLGTGPTGRACCSRAASPGCSGFGRLRSSSRVCGVEEQQRCAFLDIDPDPSAGEDVRGQHRLVAQGHGAVLGDGPLHLEDRARGPAARVRRGTATGAGSASDGALGPPGHRGR